VKKSARFTNRSVSSHPNETTGLYVNWLLGVGLGTQIHKRETMNYTTEYNHEYENIIKYINNKYIYKYSYSRGVQSGLGEELA
jgi:hypothetical protein